MLTCDLQELMEVVSAVLGQEIGTDEPVMEAGLDSIGMSARQSGIAMAASIPGRYSHTALHIMPCLECTHDRQPHHCITA